MERELFGDLPAQPQARRFQPPLFPGRYLRVRVAYEDILFSGLTLMLVLLGGFCLGVERGKRLAPGVVSQSPSVAASVRTNDLPVLPMAAAAAPPVAASGLAGRSASRNADSSSGPYVIQLASLLDAQVAKAEQERLRRQGFNAQVVKQGKYFELRAGGYRSRTEALAPLEILRRTYRDGFVKRLSS